MKKAKSTMLVENRKARFNYQVLEMLEVGIALLGNEVKSCIGKEVSISEAYCQFRNSELVLVNCNIAKYAHSRCELFEPKRTRVLLAHKSELRKLRKAIETRGLAVVPLDMHIGESGKIKLAIGVCKGKNAVDKRRTIEERQQKIEIKRLLE